MSYSINDYAPAGNQSSLGKAISVWQRINLQLFSSFILLVYTSWVWYQVRYNVVRYNVRPRYNTAYFYEDVVTW